MTAHVVYNFSDEDAAWPRLIEESFNLVWDFCRELHNPSNKQKDRSPQRVAFNRVISGEFTGPDVLLLRDYAKTIVERVRAKYTGKTIFAACPWRDAVLQNAGGLETVMTEFMAAFLAPQEAVV